ncbi:hypothetical protein K7432_013612 [Basidiobolus ranarum]|uniref:Uncharacterized protein n=1 Tax=Basidiobolus ranarum TaxID=34480 RepID=A0ABR2VQJ2_9FUNG
MSSKCAVIRKPSSGQPIETSNENSRPDMAVVNNVSCDMCDVPTLSKCFAKVVDISRPGCSYGHHSWEPENSSPPEDDVDCVSKGAKDKFPQECVRRHRHIRSFDNFPSRHVRKFWIFGHRSEFPHGHGGRHCVARSDDRHSYKRGKRHWAGKHRHDFPHGCRHCNMDSDHIFWPSYGRKHHHNGRRDKLRSIHRSYFGYGSEDMLHHKHERHWNSRPDDRHTSRCRKSHFAHHLEYPLKCKGKHHHFWPEDKIESRHDSRSRDVSCEGSLLSSIEGDAAHDCCSKEDQILDDNASNSGNKSEPEEDIENTSECAMQAEGPKE